jgi:hypothetical protein
VARSGGDFKQCSFPDFAQKVDRAWTHSSSSQAVALPKCHMAILATIECGIVSFIAATRNNKPHLDIAAGPCLPLIEYWLS